MELMIYGIKKSKKTDNKIVFLNAGTICIRKGQNILINAIEKLPKEYLDKCKFIFVGKPYDGDQDGLNIQNEILKLSINSENVVLMPQITREELFELYKEIDVLTLTSIDDPMPVVATENLMLKNIVLCTTNTGTSFYIKDKINGFVFNTNDVDELVEKIKYIVDQSTKLEKIKENGRVIFEKYFKMDGFKKKLLKIIEE